MKFELIAYSGVIVIVILGLFGYITPIEYRETVISQYDSDNLPCSFYGTCEGIHFESKGTVMWVVGTKMVCNTAWDITTCEPENTISEIGG